jgi:PleD family two-component response regulator
MVIDWKSEKGGRLPISLLIFFPAPGQGVHLTVSIGLGQYKSQEDMKAFVNRVDQLIYCGKKNGKDRVCCESTIAYP